MKKLAVFLVLVAVLALSIPTVSAQLTYDSGFQIQNLSATNADVVITYYNQDGTVNATINDVVPASGSNTYFPIDASAGFNGSVVISSNQPVAAIANVLANNFTYGASYGGFNAGATSVSLPLIMLNNSGYDTWFNVQNAGSAAADVTVTYANTTCTETATIQPGAAATFDQDTNTCLPDPYVGAATVTATQPVVATVMEVGPSQLFAYNGFTGAAASVTLPLINANNSGFITGVQVQNTGGASTDVTVTYTPVSGSGTACTETKTVAAGASDTFALYAFSLNGDPSPGTDDCVFGATFIGSAEVTASEDLVAIVNQLGGSYGSSYNGFDTAAATATVVMPLLMDRNSGFYTGFNIVASDGTATSVDCNIVGTGASGAIDMDVTIPLTGGVANALQLNNVDASFVGSGTCVGDGPVFAVVNELNTTIAGDALYSYEAFNN